MSAWNDFVKKIYWENKKKNKNYQKNYFKFVDDAVCLSKYILKIQSAQKM